MVCDGLSLVLGDLWVIPVEYTVAGGVPADLSAYDIAGILSLAGSSLDLNTSNGRIVETDMAHGAFQVEIDQSVTATLRPGTARLSVWAIDDLGNETTILRQAAIGVVTR